MNDLEEKIKRLTPEKLGEVEDFVDFLLQKEKRTAPDDLPLFQEERSVLPPGGHIIMAGEENRNNSFPGLIEDRKEETTPVTLSDLSFRKRQRPDPNHLLEWID